MQYIAKVEALTENIFSSAILRKNFYSFLGMTEPLAENVQFCCMEMAKLSPEELKEPLKISSALCMASSQSQYLDRVKQFQRDINTEEMKMQLLYLCGAAEKFLRIMATSSSLSNEYYEYLRLACECSVRIKEAAMIFYQPIEHL